MRVSLNTIKKYTEVNIGVDELVAKINAQLGGVESVTNIGDKYKDAVIVRLVACDDHPNADRLHTCKVDDGGVVADVPRDEQGHVQVVCGAPNARTDMFAVWLPPQSTVPSSFGDPDPFVLDARELRGVLSQGMLASPSELGLGDSHDGILEIDPSEWKPNDVEIKPGTKFAEAYELNDTVIDIENKMFTHRPDCFGQLGVAREIAGIQQQKFTSPDWYTAPPEFKEASGLELNVFNSAHDVVPRFMTVVIKDVTVKSSPIWLQAELVRLGAKPINNIVDVTNYIMLLTAQPTHAYDYDKLRGATLGARMAKEGETVTLLNHKTYELAETDIVIVDGEGPVGLAGIMGGGDSEVSETTKNIVLEVANFDMYTVRKSSMRHGVFTDALTRFNKGQSPLQNPAVLSLLMRSIYDVSGGEQASNVYDEHSDLPAPPVLSVESRFINERLGLSLSGKQIADLLANVEFDLVDEPHEVNERLDELAVPFWRTDIEQAEDVVEEVGRLYGFDKLPRELPDRSMMPAPKNLELELNKSIRESLSRAGANEVLTYSFVHENIIKKAGQDLSQAYRLGNALSPDLQYYRLSILPSLLDKVRPNVKNGYDEFILFEIGKGHNKLSVADDGLPVETGLVELVYTSKLSKEGAAYFRMKRVADVMLADIGINAVYKPIDKPMEYSGMAPFDQTRAALVTTQDGQMLGVIGELRQEVAKNFKLSEYSAAAAFDLSALKLASSVTAQKYVPLSRFPSVSQDITLKASASFAELDACLRQALHESAPDDTDIIVTPLSIFQKPDETEHTQTTFRIKVTNRQKTLREEEVSAMLDHVAQVCHDTLSAEKI